MDRIRYLFYFNLILLALLPRPVALAETHVAKDCSASSSVNKNFANIQCASRTKELELRLKSLGPDHPQLAATLNSLAQLYRDQGRYAEAEPLYKRSLTVQEKASRPDHSNIAATLNNLAVLYSDQGRYAEAEPLCNRSLAIYEKALGRDHPHLATTLNTLGVIYRFQSRYAEAEPLYKRSLAIDEKALGRDHPQLATTLNNLAVIYRAQGRNAEAEPLLKRSLAIYEKALGPIIQRSEQHYTIFLVSIVPKVGTRRPSRSSSVHSRFLRKHLGQITQILHWHWTT